MGQQSSPEQAIRARLDAGSLDDAATLALTSYGPEILGFLVAVERDETDGSEIFSQFCEDLWRGLPGFRGDSSVRTWAYRLARNAAQRYRRDPYRRRGRPLEHVPHLAELAERVRTSTLQYLRTDIRDGVAALREELPEEDQALLVLRVDRDLAWDEVARVLAPDDATGRELKQLSAKLRKRFERLKRRLRERAVERGLL